MATRRIHRWPSVIAVGMLRETKRIIARAEHTQLLQELAAHYLTTADRFVLVSYEAASTRVKIRSRTHARTHAC